MRNFGHIAPNWDIEQFKKLEYKFDPDPALCEEYSKVGHSLESMKFYNCFETDIDFSLSYILDNFRSLSAVTLAVNYLTPGQYIPLHSDRYERYTRLHGLDSADKIVRIILMLEDSSPGQILQIENKVIGEWKSGDWFSWSGHSLHASYNLSKFDRYALQITGTSL